LEDITQVEMHMPVTVGDFSGMKLRPHTFVMNTPLTIHQTSPAPWNTSRMLAASSSTTSARLQPSSTSPSHTRGGPAPSSCLGQT
jgi:hypothetical protein